MKKMKLNTATLQLKKERITSLTSNETNIVFGGGSALKWVCDAMNPKKNTVGCWPTLTCPKPEPHKVSDACSVFCNSNDSIL